MGNNPNQIIQCGFADKDLKKQVQTTKQYALKHQQGSQLHSQLKNNPPPEFQRVGTINGIPQHENLTKVSNYEKVGFLKATDSDFFQEAEVGRCLDEIIETRFGTTMHFPEPQLVSLLEGLVYSLAYLSKKAIPHHDFYPTNIFYKQGKFRLINPCFLNCSAYKITQQRKRFSFLAPQLIVEVLKDTLEQEIPKQVLEKADVFAIGMIILEFCTLQPSSECYHPETYNIIDAVVRERINKCCQIYDPIIGQCLEMMLEYEVTKRVNPQTLSYKVHANTSQIKSETLGILKANTQKPVPVRNPQIIEMPMKHQLPPQMGKLRNPMMQGPNTILGQPNVMGMPPNPMIVKLPPGQNTEAKKFNPFEKMQEVPEDNQEKPQEEKILTEKKEGQSESLEERVQRILQASRSIK